MKSIKEYLSQNKEEMPVWLQKYQPGDQVSFQQFMSGRVGYYPGSGEDGNLVSECNRAQCVHTFLYVDYIIPRKDLERVLTQDDAFRGYHRIGQVEWTERDLLPNGQYPLIIDYKPKRDPMQFVNKEEKPYCFMDVFERDAEKDDTWGAKRFAVAFLFADGIKTYHQLFVEQYKKAPWIILLQDHAWGCNYDAFSKGGLLDAIVRKFGVRPNYALCAVEGLTCIWDGYDEVEGLTPVRGGSANFLRKLFVDHQ